MYRTTRPDTWGGRILPPSRAYTQTEQFPRPRDTASVSPRRISRCGRGVFVFIYGVYFWKSVRAGDRYNFLPCVAWTSRSITPHPTNDCSLNFFWSLDYPFQVRVPTVWKSAVKCAQWPE